MALRWKPLSTPPICWSASGQGHWWTGWSDPGDWPSRVTFFALSERDGPQGIIVLIRIEDHSLATIPLSDDMLAIVACQLRDPGNQGSIIRTADAAGATGVVVVGPSADIHDPRAVRATMGSLFALPIVRLSSEKALTLWYTEVRAAGVPLFVVASSAASVMACRCPRSSTHGWSGHVTQRLGGHGGSGLRSDPAALGTRSPPKSWQWG